MFDEVLIESAGQDRKTGGWITALISAVIHLVIIGTIVAGGLYGGVIGGTLGGKVGGQVGGTGDLPMPVGGNVKAPVAVQRVDPNYTEVARRARIEGFAIIEAVIDRQGNVTEARVLEPLPFGLDAAALQAVKQWKFQPGTLNGQPVPVYYNLTVRFRIE